MADGRLFICNEDLAQVSSQTAYSSSAPYFSLYSCCSISDICETVISFFSLFVPFYSHSSSRCHVNFPCTNLNIVLLQVVESQGRVVSLKIKENRSVESVVWKLKWCSTENALKFVTLVTALRPESPQWPLAVRYRR